MGEFAEIILSAGRAGVELGLFILLPVMIVMLTVMRLLEAWGILDRVARLLAPVLKPFGLPGLGGFAMIQSLFVSFAAPMSTLAVMDKGNTSRRHIAATLAFVIGGAQGNVLFPAAAIGVNAPAVIGISVICGLIGSTLTYYVFARQYPLREDREDLDAPHEALEGKKGILDIITLAGREAFNITLTAIPMVVLAMFIVGIIRATGGMGLLEMALAPALGALDIPVAATAALVAKAIAGGTAGLGLIMEGMDAGVMTMTDFNRLAGLLINPYDVAGIAIIITAGKRVAEVLKPALLGGGIAMLLRAIFHLTLF